MPEELLEDEELVDDEELLEELVDDEELLDEELEDDDELEELLDELLPPSGAPPQAVNPRKLENKQALSSGMVS